VRTASIIREMMEAVRTSETSVCILLVVMGRDFVSALQPVAYCSAPDESECDRVSERDRLGLTPNLTTRDLWRSRRWARK
jgi:hypothetical protein